MKRFYLLALSTIALTAFASNKYVTPSGDDAADGKSWATALATIQTAVWNCPAGDTIFLAEGTYNQAFSVGDGITLLGGYNPANGLRDIEQYPTILDGTGLDKWIIVKYDGDPENHIFIDGLTMQNANHNQEGGAIFMRGNMTLSNCYIHHCHGSNGGGIMIEAGSSGVLPLVRNCIIELCSSSSSGGGIRNKGGLVENCIIRGCQGKYGTIRNDAGTIRNCVLHNNAATVSGWPNSGGIYNLGGVVEHCTVCNNYGDQYAGIHSDGAVYNSVFWGNKPQDGFGDPVNYIAGSPSTANVADQGFNDEAFLSNTLAAENTAAEGPNFRNPTAFVGLPANDAEITMMRNADFSLTDASAPLINNANASFAPATDINGVARPKGTGSDIGAYEFDPEAHAIAVTGVSIIQDTLFVIKGQSGTLSIIISPADANNKRVSWTIDNPAVATIQNGAVTGVEEGKTVARVTTQEGGFTDTAVVVILPIPPVKYPAEVLAADEKYLQQDYTVPSFIPFLAAKEAARIDSLSASPEEIASIATKIADMNSAIAALIGKEEPYNMIANINGDPMTRMAFCWFTNEGIIEGQVQLLPFKTASEKDFETAKGLVTLNAEATTTKALNYAVSTSGILAQTKLPAKTAFTYVSHKALAESLTPGTVYSYRVGYKGHWSNIAYFQTAEATPSEYSFLYLTDSHIMDREYVDNAHWCATAAVKTAPDARFCLFPGDFVETGTAQNSEWEWERWFEESVKPVINAMPIVPTDGNHDDSENLNYNYHFNTDRQFNAVAKTKPQFDGITYSFVYGDILFLVYSLQDWWRASGSSESAMTSSYLSTDLANWFKEQIAANPNTKYRVTLAHKNIFSGSGHSVDSETPLFREIMLPIMKECEIDLAIQGHDHCYEVIGPVNPDTRTAITSAVSDVKKVEINTNTNMTGKEGGTFVTDEGTLYFIGATCGRKRYYPYSREEMDKNYDKHKVTNYFDLFTGMFGQPGAPSFTLFTVKPEGLEMKSYTADSEGKATLINTMLVKRTKDHSTPTGYNTIHTEARDGEKFIRNGQLLIKKNGVIYNAQGTIIR